MLTTNQILQQGRYRIVNRFAQYPAGAGYEAFDTVLNANVLLKEVRDNSGKVMTPAQIETRRAAFSEKAKPLTAIKHESLLCVKNIFSEIDHHYLVTEAEVGSSLAELLEKKTTPFPTHNIINWADNLLDALNYLHTFDPPVIHGEVKPQNIRLLLNGKVKLTIFNLFKNTDEINAVTPNQTFDAAVLPYLPLEQIWKGLDPASKKVILTNYDEKSEKILEQPLDARSDVYSLAATLYYLLTARIPADALTRSIDILEGKSDPLQSPSAVNPSVSKEISEVLMKALEIKRENRFSSAVITRQVLRTAFTRVKENAAAPVGEDDSVLEIPVSPMKPAAPKNPEMESEQARQLELMKQQLREAEARRLEAEQRAAEAEKRLLEAEEKHISIEPAAQEEAENFQPAEYLPFKPEVLPEPVIQPAFETKSADEFSTLFAEPPKEGGAFKKAAAAAVVLLVLGGAGFGIWTFTQTKSVSPTMTTTNAAVPAATTENTPAPAAENTPEPSAQASTETNPQPDAEPSTDASVPASNPSPAKTKAATPTPQTAQAKKPTATPPKTTETQKKVTLDDLLKDN